MTNHRVELQPSPMMSITQPKRRQQRSKEQRKKAETAIERVQKGEPSNRLDHNQEFIKYIATVRYGQKDSLMSTIPLAKAISLTRSFKLNEWRAIEQRPDLLERALREPADLDSWIPFWRNVNGLNPDWGRIVLLEVTCEFWKGNAADLIDGVLSLSRGTLPTSQPPELGQERQLRKHCPPGSTHSLAPPAIIKSPSEPVASLWQTTVLKPAPDPISAIELAPGINRSSENTVHPGFTTRQNHTPHSNTSVSAVVANSAEWKRSQLLQHIKLRFWNDPSKVSDIEASIDVLEPEYVSDLYDSVALGSGLETLSAAVAHRQSILMRLSGNVAGSEQVINGFLSNSRDTKVPPDKLAALHLSQAANHMYHFRFNDAQKEIKRTTGFSGVQEDFLWDQMLCLSRALKGAGEFDAARTVLQVCLATPGLCRPKRCLVISALADVLCELSFTDHDNLLLHQAEALVTQELHQFGLYPHRFPQPRGLRRLRLSLLEIKINQGSYYEAEFLVEDLLDAYRRLEKLDIVDQLGHVRALIAYARLAPVPEEAVSRWTDVLNWNKLYNPDEEEVFTCGAIYIVLCSLCLDLGNQEAGLDFFRRGTNVLGRKERQFLLPGIGTYIFRAACAGIGLHGLELHI
ncbi:hypothetical protein ACJZ2D_014356 [Fusarium nematophilum]